MTKHRGPVHGASLYKRGCRCDKCRIANTAYEARRRANRRLPPKPVLKSEDDTLTRGEFMRYRYGQ